MEVVTAVLAITFFILDIILFFKLWGACDNIKRIADKYAPMQTNVSNKPRRERKPSRAVKDSKWDDFNAPPETKEDVERWLNEDK